MNETKNMTSTCIEISWDALVKYGPVIDGEAIDVVSGYHIVNRRGYIVTQTPFEAHEIISVTH